MEILQPKYKRVESFGDHKTTQMKINLEEMHVIDMINLH